MTMSHLRVSLAGYATRVCMAHNAARRHSDWIGAPNNQPCHRRPCGEARMRHGEIGREAIFAVPVFLQRPGESHGRDGAIGIFARGPFTYTLHRDPRHDL